jgi:hypothetical protein
VRSCRPTSGSDRIEVEVRGRRRWWLDPGQLGFEDLAGLGDGTAESIIRETDGAGVGVVLNNPVHVNLRIES